MSALEDLQQHCTANLALVAATVERLQSGATFVDLVEDRIEVRAATLAAILEQVGPDDLKLIWTGNPLRSPLTIERLILQAAGPEADLRQECTPEQLARMLAVASGDAGARLVIVQQPETLDPVARETLAEMRPHLAAASPRDQLLFCGTSAFHPIDPPPPPAPPARTDLALVLPLEDAPPPLRREAIPLLLLLAITALGSLWSTSTKPDLSPTEPAHAAASTSAPGAPAPIASAPAAPAPAASASGASAPGASAPGASAPGASASETSAPAAPASGAPSSVDVASLRREFEEFLAQQPHPVSKLTPDQRDVLFQEYLARAKKSGTPQRL